MACAPRLHAPPPYLINTLCKKNQTPVNFLFYGHLKIKHTGYGWMGKMQIISTPAALRIDLLTDLDWPLLTAVVRKGRVEIIFYNERKVYIGKRLPDALKRWLPAGLKLDEWATMLGKQCWLIDYKGYTYKEKKAVFLLYFVGKKGRFKEELWLGKKDLKVEKIVLKNRMGDTLWTACFSYNAQGQPISAHIKDMLGTHIEVNYERLDLTPTITPELFDVHILSGHP